MTGMRMTFRTHDMGELLEKVQKVGASLEESVDRALDEGAKIALEGMQKRVPVRTGFLANHLRRIPAEGDGVYHYSIAEVDFDDRESILYAVYVEFGTALRPAQPFMRPAFDEDAAAIRRAMRDSLKKDGTL